MPTYDYECLDCKHHFEMFQSMKDDPIDKCVKCGGKVKKLIGAGAGIIFKGSGFYVNDYKKSSPVAKGPSPASNCSSCPSSSECASNTAVD